MASFREAPLTFAPRGRGLNASRQAKDDRLGNEQHEAAKADRRERRVAVIQAADHRSVDQIKDVLRHHAADDRQGQTQDAIEALLVEHRGGVSVCVRYGVTGRAFPGEEAKARSFYSKAELAAAVHRFYFAAAHALRMKLITGTIVFSQTRTGA